MDQIISIDCGGTNLRVAALDRQLNIIAVRRTNTVRNDPLKLYSKMKELILEVQKEAHMDKIEAIGMSMCGIVMCNKIGKVGNLGLDGYDFVPLFNRDFPGTRLNFANDANCSALVEYEYGANKGHENSAFVTISTGIGIGLIVNGEILDAPLEGGRLMTEYMGKIYETEYLLSGTGIVNLARLNGIEISSAKDFFDGVRAKDNKMLSLYNTWIKMLGLWFGNLQLMFNVDQYAISGGVLKSSDIFMDDLAKISNASIASWKLNPIKFVNAHFLQDVGIAAGGALAWHILKR